MNVGMYDVIYSLPCNFMSGGRAIMKCPKCRGRMFSEKYYDFVRSYYAWKCTCCGEVLDSTILSNRARSRNVYLG